MKRLALILVITLACGVTSYAQLHLKSGDVFICQFTNLSNPDTRSGPPARGQFASYGTLQPASEFRCEIFENNIADPVLCSGVFPIRGPTSISASAKASEHGKIFRASFGLPCYREQRR